MAKSFAPSQVRDLSERELVSLLRRVRYDVEKRSSYAPWADDIVAEAALWLLEHAKSKIPHSNQLLTFAARRLFGETRKTDRRDRVASPDMTDGVRPLTYVPNPESLLNEGLDLEAILRRDDRYDAWLFIEHEIRGRSSRELATTLDIPYETLRKHLRIIRQRIRSGLIDLGYEFGPDIWGEVRPGRTKAKRRV